MATIRSLLTGCVGVHGHECMHKHDLIVWLCKMYHVRQNQSLKGVIASQVVNRDILKCGKTSTVYCPRKEFVDERLRLYTAAVGCDIGLDIGE